MGVAAAILHFHPGCRPKFRSESPCGRESTGCADVVFRASGPAFVQPSIGLLDSQVIPAAVLSCFFARWTLRPHVSAVFSADRYVLGYVECRTSESNGWDVGGDWRRFVDARHRNSLGPDFELGEGQTTCVPNQVKLGGHVAARTVEPVAVGSGTMNTQRASDGVSIEAGFDAILLGKYLESLDLMVEALDGDPNTEGDGVNENPTQGRREGFCAKYPEVTAAATLFE